MWHCPECDQMFDTPVAHLNPSGEICPGIPTTEEAQIADTDLKKRLSDAFFIASPFSLTFLIAFFVTEMAYPVVLLAALAVPIGSLLFAALHQKPG